MGVGVCCTNLKRSVSCTIVCNTTRISRPGGSESISAQEFPPSKTGTLFPAREAEGD